MSEKFGLPLSTQVSTDTSPLTPRGTPSSMPGFMPSNFTSGDISYDAQPGRRGPGTGRPVASRQQTGRISPLQIEKLPADPVDKSSGNLNDKLTSLTIGDISIESSYSENESDVTSENWDKTLAKYIEKMPPEVRINYIDALILYAEDDRSEALAFRDHLINDIDIGGLGPVRARLYDQGDYEATVASKLGHLSWVFARSTYTFMYLTKNFVHDMWMNLSSESCLMDSIYSEEKRWCVVPVYTEKRSTKQSFKTPMGLNSLKGINYYNNDQFYKNGVSRLIGDRVSVRVQRENDLKTKQKKWIEDYEREENLKQLQIKKDDLNKRLKAERVAQQKAAEIEQLEKKYNSFSHSMSESQLSSFGTSSYGSSMSHSPSAPSLKAQNQNVKDYFQQLHTFNMQAITPDQNTYGPIYNPAVETSRYNQNVVRSPSQGSNVSGDMGFATGQAANSPIQFPKELLERIIDQPPEQQEHYMQMYLEQQKQQQQQQQPQLLLQQQQLLLQQQQHQQMQQQYQIQQQQPTRLQHMSPMLNSQLAAGQQPSQQFNQTVIPPTQNDGGILFNQAPYLGYQFVETMGNQPFVSAPGNQHVPHFEELSSGSYKDDCMVSQRSDESRSLNSSDRSFSTNGDHSPQLSASVDCPRSSVQGINGNMPNSGLFHSLEEDCGSCVQHVKKIVTHKGSESDEEVEENAGKKKKDKKQHIVHYTVNVYSASTVQIGDANIVQNEGEQKAETSENSEVETDDEDRSEDDATETGSKMAGGDDGSTVEKLKADEATDFLSRNPPQSANIPGEMCDQQQNSGPQNSVSLCNMDAALSSVGTIVGNSVHSEQPTIIEQQKGGKIDLPKISEENVSSVTNTLPAGMEKLIASPKDETSFSPERSSPRQKVVLPEKPSEVNNSNVNKNKTSPMQRVSPMQEARPVGSVAPQRQVKEDREQTNLKSIVESEQTLRKEVAPSRSWQGQSSDTPAQMLTKAQRNDHCDIAGSAVMDDNTSTKQDSNKVKFSLANYGEPSKLFYNNQFGQAVAGENSNDDLLDGSLSESLQGEGQTTAVALGHDPLSMETTEPEESQQGPATQPFTPQSMNDEDLEFDMLNSFEGAEYGQEVGPAKKKGINKRSVRGSKDACVIS